MLSLHKFRPPRSAALTPFRHRYGRRTPPLSRGFLTGLGTEFLDLALALPIPPSWPAYSTAIIVVTVVTRFALLPVSIWVRSLATTRRILLIVTQGKRKSRIIEEVVVPQLEKERHVIAKNVFEQMKVDDPSHAFYLGYELMKAKTALTLNKAYRQDQALDWGFLTEPEISHRERKTASRSADDADERR